jgi:membrane protease YdiL (CAAX protease family)
MEVPALNGTGVSRKSVWAFLILAVVLSWPVWVISGVLPRGGMGAYDGRWLVAQIGVMGPSLAALIMSASLSRELYSNSLRLLPFVLCPLVVPGILVAQASPFRVSLMPTLPAVATVIVAALVVLFLSLLNGRLLGPATGMPQPRPAASVVLLSLALPPALFLLSWLIVNAQGGNLAIALLQAGPAGSTQILLVCFAHNLLLGGSLGEEIGWRGFLLPALLKEMRPSTASVVLAVVSGLWHLPVDLYAGFGVTGVGAILARIIFLVPVSMLFTWFYLHSKGSLLVAVLLHTSINVMSDVGLSSFETTTIVFGLLAGVATLILWVPRSLLRGPAA